VSRAAVAILALLIATACTQAPDTLRIERVLEDAAVGRFDPLDRTVTDAATVRDIHDALVALPAAPRGGNEPFCPISWGLGYRLTFAHTGTTTRVAVLEADGCRYAHLSPTDRRTTTESLWAALAGALGYYTRGNELFPLPTEMRRP
jgi:hypothetical protein